MQLETEGVYDVPFGYHLEEDGDLSESGSGRYCWPSRRVSQTENLDKAYLAAAVSDGFVEASIHCELDRAMLSDNRFIVGKVYADVPSMRGEENRGISALVCPKLFGLAAASQDFSVPRAEKLQNCNFARDESPNKVTVNSCPHNA